MKLRRGSLQVAALFGVAGLLWGIATRKKAPPPALAGMQVGPSKPVAIGGKITVG